MSWNLGKVIKKLGDVWFLESTMKRKKNVKKNYFLMFGLQ